MIASTEDPSTNAVATPRGQDGTSQSQAGPADSVLTAGCSDARPVEGSSVGVLELKPSKELPRLLTLRREAGGNLAVTLSSRNSIYLGTAWDKFDNCYLSLRDDPLYKGFVCVSAATYLVSDSEALRIREAFPDLAVHGGRRR